MTESTPASVLDGLTFEAVEWLPSGAETGLVRVRGRWSTSVGRPEGLPELCASVGGGVSRYSSLPDAPSARGNGSVWRGAYLLPEAIARSGIWLEWPSGERSALPVPAGLDERVAPVIELVDVPDEEEDTGGEVIDRAVMAERRARRAEAAEQAQARVASEALRALDALELRGAELEARVDALVGERDELAARAEALEKRTPRDEHQRAALADALAAAATARRRARDWQLRMRAAEVARSSDAVRLRVLEAREAGVAGLRAERVEHEAGLAEARERASALEAEAARAREQAVAAATDLDDARRDFATRLAATGEWESRAETAEAELETTRAALADHESELATARSELEEIRAELAEARAWGERTVGEARAAAESEVAEVRSAADAQVAEVRAAADAELAEVRAAADARVADAESQLTDLRTALEAERAARAAAGAAAETARSRAESAAAALRTESVARATLEEELDRERAARSALSDALDAETAALASLHAQLNTARTELARAPDPAVQDELERERAARQADQSALAALRDDLATERAALAEVRAQLESLRAEVQEARAGSRDELAAELRAEMEAAREADRAVLAALRADLNAERAAREADQAELVELRSRLAEAEREGGLLDRVAELDRRAAGLADELELQRRAREQAEAAAAAAHAPAEESSRVVADLDAAASALRDRAANGVTAPEGAAPRAAEPDVAEPDADRADDKLAAGQVSEAGDILSDVARAEADAALAPAAAPPAPEKRAIVSAPSPPSRALATGQAQRQYPWLRGALVKLAHDDPKLAGQIIAGLLPVQSAIVQGPVDYDLTIAEVGTFAITLAGGRAYVKEIDHPRGRRQAEFHIWATALTLAEIIAGVPHHVGRFRGPAKITGRKRRMKPLKAIPAAGLSLAEAARAGARLEPGLVFRTFPYVVHAAWSRDHQFTVAQSVSTDPPSTWYVTVGNGQGIRVDTTPPPEGADATVSLTPEAFSHLLRGEPAPPGHRPVVRGDRQAVAQLKAWIDRAQGA